MKIPNFSEFWIWEFENSFGEHLKLNFKINDICCWSCSSSFCRLGWWGCNYNILLRFYILHPLRDSWDQTSIPLFHEKKNFFLSQVFLVCQLFFWRFLVNYLTILIKICCCFMSFQNRYWTISYMGILRQFWSDSKDRIL